jgi:hypothetical protein
MLNRMRKPAVPMILLLALLLAACGGEPAATATLVPSETPIPTEAPPTNTPQPTVDVASLSVTELQATAEALEEEIAVEERHLESASGSEGASVQALIDRLRRSLREVQALIDAAGGAAEATVEATAES